MDERSEATQLIPMLDLGRAVERVDRALGERWRKLLDTTAFVGGPEVGAFEEAFARFTESAACVGVGNGTDALVLALRALGCGAGDEVIVPSFTFAATAEAVALVGARPVFADIDEATCQIDPEDVERRVTPATVGVLGVHLYGCAFDLEAMGSLCSDRKLWLIEDAAQAHGARYNGRRVGNVGDLATWSFYPTKNLGAFGDGGAVTSAKADLAKRVRLLANHGATARYHHEIVGSNSRLDALQAAVLNCRLQTLESDNTRRRAIASAYDQAIADLSTVRRVVVPSNCESVFHQYTVRTDDREELTKHLEEHGVSTSVHYPEPLHSQPAFAQFDPPKELPGVQRAAREVLCLPMFAELTDTEVGRVAQALRSF